MNRIFGLPDISGRISGQICGIRPDIRQDIRYPVSGIAPRAENPDKYVAYGETLDHTSGIRFPGLAPRTNIRPFWYPVRPYSQLRARNTCFNYHLASSFQFPVMHLISKNEKKSLNKSEEEKDLFLVCLYLSCSITILIINTLLYFITLVCF